MSNDKIKVYKNKERSKPEVNKNYVPQYQIMGIEPEEIKSAVSTGQHTISIPDTNDNPRTRRVSVRQPYAELDPSFVSGNKGPVPNVGNNMEHTWSSVDELIDDLSEIEPNHQMIDNNDYVSEKALGILQPAQIENPVKTFVAPEEDATISVVSELSEGDYLLLAGGVSICSGPVIEIQEQARLLVFGEHPLCDGNPIPIDDIIVIKRVPIKIGLFLE